GTNGSDRAQSKGAAELSRVRRQLAGKKRSKLIDPAERARGAELSLGDTDHGIIDQLRTSVVARRLAPVRSRGSGGLCLDQAPGSSNCHRVILAAPFRH